MIGSYVPMLLMTSLFAFLGFRGLVVSRQAYKAEKHYTTVTSLITAGVCFCLALLLLVIIALTIIGIIPPDVVPAPPAK